MFRFLSFSVVVLVGLSLAADQANAQRRVPNYSRRPTVSPYINLFNSNQGGVNNYFSFVRPLQQQAQVNQQQFNQNARLQQQVFNQQQAAQFGTGQITLGAPVGGVPSMLRPGAQGVGMPSTAATFFNYSHYYPVPQQGRARR